MAIHDISKQIEQRANIDKIFARWHLAIAVTSYSLNVFISNNLKIQYFPIFRKFNTPPPNFSTLKTVVGRICSNIYQIHLPDHVLRSHDQSVLESIDCEEKFHTDHSLTAKGLIASVFN